MKTKRRVKKMFIVVPIVLICMVFIAWVSAYIYFKASNDTNAQAFIKRFEAVTTSKNIHQAVLFVENSTGDVSESYSYGGHDIDSEMLIASVTKMFTTTCIIKLVEDGRLSLDEKISHYLDDEILNGLHIYKGVDYSRDLTISDLLFQTSGLPDYFTSSEIVNNALFKEDAYLSFELCLEENKKLTPRFAPNTGKANYADINFDLLGEILEKVTNLPLEDIYNQFIFESLRMENTYLPVSEDDFIPHTYIGLEKVERPLLIASCRASGGCVSTARDMMAFSKAFWGGELFGKAILEQLSKYRRLQLDMKPIQYGGGYMRIPLGGLNTFFLADGELVGHSGSTGSFVFYYPEKDLHFVGDISQLENRSTAVRFIMQLAMSVK